MKKAQTTLREAQKDLSEKREKAVKAKEVYEAGEEEGRKLMANARLQQEKLELKNDDVVRAGEEFESARKEFEDCVVNLRILEDDLGTSRKEAKALENRMRPVSSKK